MQTFVIPHCSACFRDLTETAGPLQALCNHLFCADCLTTLPYVCPIDGTTCDATSVAPRPDISQHLVEHLASSDLEGTLEAVFVDINTRGVLCKFVHRGLQCPDIIHCKYIHGVSRVLSGGLDCQKCFLRLAPGVEVCPFCKTTGTHRDSSTQAETLSPGFRQSEAESLTSSTDFMRSLDPVFPKDCEVARPPMEESKASAKDFNILQSYVDLAMSDSDSEVEEEVVVISPATKSALLQLLRTLWQFFRESAVALLARLSRKPDNTMVFYS